MPAVVAVFLPLSAIWASTSTNGNINIAAPQQWQHRPSAGSSAQYGRSCDKQLLTATVQSADTYGADGRAESFSGASPKKYGHSATVERDSIDLEMAKVGGQNIQINRTYNVRTD